MYFISLEKFQQQIRSIDAALSPRDYLHVQTISIAIVVPIFIPVAQRAQYGLLYGD
ncbi:MAG TPA: hypothetical protein VIL31_01920 [Cyclobacteriaceae bacterium]|jgi:hypothetical protein